MPFPVTRSLAAVVLVACVAGAAAGYAIAAPSGRSSAAARLTGSQLAARLVPASALPAATSSCELTRTWTRN